MVDGVVELLGVVVFGVACEFGVVAVPLGVIAVPLGVVVAPLEVDPGVIVPLLLLAPVVLLPVLEDCGTPVELAGTQFEAVLVEDGAVLFDELGEDAVVEPVVLGEVLEVALGEVLFALGEEVAVEELGEADALVEAVMEPVVEALALVFGTMPAGQLFIVEDEPGVVAAVPMVEPVCDEVVPVELPVCDEVDVEGDVVVVVCVFVVDVVCAAAHVATAVSTRINVNFFMFSVLVSRVA